MSGSVFSADPGFCSKCGSILPLLRSSGGLTCYTCKTDFKAEDLDIPETHYVLHFNNVESETEEKKSGKNKKKQGVEGPVVERKCPRCGHDEMSYATLQLRSADEGQTVFYTCTKCRYKESENS